MHYVRPTELIRQNDLGGNVINKLETLEYAKELFELIKTDAILKYKKSEIQDMLYKLTGDKSWMLKGTKKDYINSLRVFVTDKLQNL